MLDFLFEFSKKRNLKGALLFYFGHLVLGLLIFSAFLFLLQLGGPLSGGTLILLSSLFAAVYRKFAG